ncbi:hypothetical protein KQX54_000782 [Cotesia glomerata]|uniref:Uncharacterized protein n=1 Tax=Cotesia glomerata TaxID=32391 RepID=A0AAV7IP62_COTGL|nr:hypothetical protein KQX54_000782 [Cotesia glomerata]
MEIEDWLAQHSPIEYTLKPNNEPETKTSTNRQQRHCKQPPPRELEQQHYPPLPNNNRRSIQDPTGLETTFAHLKARTIIIRH